jgi:adenylyltransferase/sulfurtransferase
VNVDLSLDLLANKLNASGMVQRTAYFIRCQLNDPASVTLTVFPDGRTLVQGVTDINRAKALHARFIGS